MKYSIRAKKAAFAALTLSVVLFGCSSNTADSSQRKFASSSSSTETSIVSSFVIGSEDESSKTIALENKTYEEIIALFIWPVNGKLPDRTLLGNNKVVPVNGSVKWALPEWEESQSEYYIEITLRDGTNFILRNVDFQTLPEKTPVSVEYKDGIGYLTYTDTNGESVNTYDWQVAEDGKDITFTTDNPGVIFEPVDGDYVE